MPPTEDTSIKIQTIINKLSGLHFGLKSHTIWITNVISEHNYMKLCTITTILHLFGDCNFLPKKKRVLIEKFSKFATQRLLCFLFSWNLIGYFKQPLKSDWLVLVMLSHWLGKRWNLENKLVRFLNKSHCWERIRPQGSPVISKWI